MAVLKCKMCGGELSFEEGVSVCECEYCGCKQTVPNVDDEKKAKQYVRANKLRAACDFDKAAGVYESIIEDYEDEAEAYWGLVLCKYGIEYVTDPATANKVPTCHRSGFDSVMDDEDFEMVMETSDPVARAVYREQAKDIEEIRKKIIEVSGKEEPYDIFICYKETGEDGQRTLDSVLAQDVYDAFTEKGYRVFFSRITLEDKLGQEYEPYIFAALNSAKVMLAFGTSYDNYNAVWVKNEWSRYLKLMEKDKSKHLIPCYKDIDAYDMPAEFKHLQGQDMSKIGFIQDLVRGVEKIIPLGKGSEKVDAQIVQAASGPNVASLLERAELFLEDEDWKSVKEYCDKVLDIEPKNATAYLYQTCARYRKQKANDLITIEDDFENSDSFKKAYRFADENMKLLLDEIVMKTKMRRNEEEQRKQAEEQRKQAEAEIKKSELKEIRDIINSANISVKCSGDGVVGLKADGRVVATGKCNVSEWTDIISIACGGSRTVGLKADGSVVATGYNNPIVSEWTDIVSIACDGDGNHTVGLKADGSVVSAGDNFHGQRNVSEWTDIISIVCGDSRTVGLKADGSVVATGYNDHGECNVSEWTDIISIACGARHTVGLKADGSVVATGDYFDGKCNVSEWTDIISIACGAFHTVGLKSDGTVEATGSGDNGEIAVSGWTDIVSIACDEDHTVGLKADGSVVATGGANMWRQYDVSGWTDIVSIACSGDGNRIAVLKADGSVRNEYGDVSELKLFDSQDQLKEMAEKRVECIEKIKEHSEDARKLAAERRKLAAERRSQNVCQHCGGEFKGMLVKKCMQCGKGKDY